MELNVALTQNRPEFVARDEQGRAVEPRVGNAILVVAYESTAFQVGDEPIVSLTHTGQCIEYRPHVGLSAK